MAKRKRKNQVPALLLSLHSSSMNSFFSAYCGHLKSPLSDLRNRDHDISGAENEDQNKLSVHLASLPDVWDIESSKLLRQRTEDYISLIANVAVKEVHMAGLGANHALLGFVAGEKPCGNISLRCWTISGNMTGRLR